MTKKTVRISEAAKRAKCSHDLIRKLIAQGKLSLADATWPKRLWLDEVETWMARRDNDHQPRAGSDWPLLRDVAKSCGVSGERLLALKLRKGWRYIQRGRNAQWVRAIHPIDAKALIARYHTSHQSPPGWIPSKDGPFPFPNHFPRLPKGVLTAARKNGRRLGAPLAEQRCTIFVNRRIRDVLHFRFEEIERLNSQFLGGNTPDPAPPKVNGHPIGGRPVKTATDPVARFIYERRVKLVSWQAIQIQAKREWPEDTPDTIGGCIKLAGRYARRNALPELPPGKRGRPPKM